MTQLWRCGGPHPEPDTPCHKPAGAWIPHTGTPEPGSSPVPTPAELDPPHKRTSELPRGSGTSPPTDQAPPHLRQLLLGDSTRAHPSPVHPGGTAARRAPSDVINPRREA